MSRSIVFLTIPGLRDRDLAAMPKLMSVMSAGEKAQVSHSFPAVTWPSQATMLTGKHPSEHGVVSNGFYWRDKQEVEMWTAWNEKIEAPQIWDVLHKHNPDITSAAWFPMLSKGCGADYICMPAPVHNPDGSESLWCYTAPTELYGELLEKFGHFPLKHFWGPLANIQSTAWIADTAAFAAGRYKPEFFYIYLPHLDYAAQKNGPDSPEAHAAVAELDEQIGKLIESCKAAYGDVVFMAVSEYVITPVDHVSYPNRILREAGLLKVEETETGELIDFENSLAWALVDHQFSHVYVKDADPQTISTVSQLFTGVEGIEEVLTSSYRAKYRMDHERSGEVILVSTPNSWQAYYYWLEDAKAPGFAHTVDIHRKPGYDPVELFFDMETKSVPLDATLVKGSHGAPAKTPAGRGVLLCSKDGLLPNDVVGDTEIAPVVVKWLTKGR